MLKTIYSLHIGIYMYSGESGVSSISTARALSQDRLLGLHHFIFSPVDGRGQPENFFTTF